MVPASDACHGFVQVEYPDVLNGVPPDSAEAQLRVVIWTCLRSRPKDRPAASQVQGALHKIMPQFALSSSLADAVASLPTQQGTANSHCHGCSSLAALLGLMRLLALASSASARLQSGIAWCSLMG